MGHNPGNAGSVKGLPSTVYTFSDSQWCYDRLPKYLREELANAHHNWYTRGIYEHWKGINGKQKLAARHIVEMIREKENRP